jgi:hypothetical protein
MRAYRILLGILTNKKRPLRSSRKPERLSTLFLFTTSAHKSTIVTNRNSPGIYLLQNNRARHFYISFFLATSVVRPFWSHIESCYLVFSSFGLAIVWRTSFRNPEATTTLKTTVVTSRTQRSFLLVTLVASSIESCSCWFARAFASNHYNEETSQTLLHKFLVWYFIPRISLE